MAQLQRVIILGGGMASLAAAFELARQPDAAQRYDITVYQLGWRLGGKCASSRNLARPDRRIEEHGLHVWFGCYENAFGMLRHCYRELGRESDMEALFQGQTDTPYMEDVNGWKVWPIRFPRKYGQVGVGPTQSSAFGHLSLLLQFAMEQTELLLTEVLQKISLGSPGGALSALTLISSIASLMQNLQTMLDLLTADDFTDQSLSDQISDAIDVMTTLLSDLPLIGSSLSDAVRRARIAADLAYASARGMAKDGVLFNGFDPLDAKDFRQWLGEHGARAETIDSAPVRALYDLCFAYRDGIADWLHADFGAGAALKTVLRIALDYPDYVLYEMRAGMGEVVVAPIYEYLRSRNVKFEFFHRVTRLDLSADQKSVAAVHFARQVDLLQSPYSPLIDAQSPLGPLATMKAWPAEPHYGQIQNGGNVRGYNLESKWSGWNDVEPDKQLQAAVDFDHVILGVSIDSSKEICATFAGIPEWSGMFANIVTVQTCSAQLWMTYTLSELGWSYGPVVIDAAPEPLDVWADRTDLLRCEKWPMPAPKSLQYFCGPLEGDWGSRPANDPTVPDQAHAQTKALVAWWLEAYAAAIWPQATAGGAFDWNTLADANNGAGSDRLDAQFLRANIDSSERYVLSVAGSTRYRLAANNSRLSNLFLAGDWTHSDWNAGCVETAVTTGINAAKALALVTDGI